MCDPQRVTRNGNFVHEAKALPFVERSSTTSSRSATSKAICSTTTCKVHVDRKHNVCIRRGSRDEYGMDDARLIFFFFLPYGLTEGRTDGRMLTRRGSSTGPGLCEATETRWLEGVEMVAGKGDPKVEWMKLSSEWGCAHRQPDQGRVTPSTSGVTRRQRLVSGIPGWTSSRQACSQRSGMGRTHRLP